MIDSTVANSTEKISSNIIFIAWLMLTSKLAKGNSKGFEVGMCYVERIVSVALYTLHCIDFNYLVLIQFSLKYFK